MSKVINGVPAFSHMLAGLQGDAYLEGDEGYAQATKAWNLNAQQHPRVVVMAERAADVALAVRFAREASIGVGVMATGHGVGVRCNGGVLINTSRMRGVQVNPIAQTARVEAGALWKDLIPEAQLHSLVGLSGSAPHVGIVGYTVGGGFGWLGRRYGLNATSVTRAQIVTANGDLLPLSDTQNPELFWGLKGGGGNFGIVTELEFKLYPLSRVYAGSVYYPAEQARAVLTQYAQWSKSLPEDMTTAVAFMNIPSRPTLPKPLQGQSVIVVRGCYCGEHLDQGEALFRAVREGLGDPIMDTFREMPVSEMSTISMDPVDPMGLIQRAGLLSDLSAAAIDTLIQVAGFGSGSPLLIVELRQLGGALRPGPEQLGLLGNGQARYSLNAIGVTPTPALEAAGRAQLKRLFETTRPYQTGETFLNYLEVDPDPNQVRSAYQSQDWQRLVALKTAHDPENRFRFNRNIPPEATR